METILAAVDNSIWTPVVAEYASDLARMSAGRVLAAYIVDSRLVQGAFARLLGEELLHSGAAEAADSLAALLERHGREAIQLVASICERKRVKCEPKLDRGRPAQAIASLAPLYDLAVVGSHGSESDFRSCLLGSTTGELTRIATRPLLVVRKEYNPISHALVGYDASPEATRALDAVVKLAVAGKWRLTIAVVTSHEPAGHTVAAQAERFRGLEHVEHEVIVRRGDAPHTLLELLDDTRAGLVAVGARGQNKLAKFLLGSTSDTLLCQSPVPVMVFR